MTKLENRALRIIIQNPFLVSNRNMVFFYMIIGVANCNELIIKSIILTHIPFDVICQLWEADKQRYVKASSMAAYVVKPAKAPLRDRRES